MRGKPRVLFTKDRLPEDKECEKYKAMVDFLKDMDITVEEYSKCLQSTSETSIATVNIPTETIEHTPSVIDH